MSDAKVQRERMEAYQQSVDEVLLALGTDGRRGLSDGEARARLESFGKNELTAKKLIPRWRKFLAQFRNVLVILLLTATVISAGLWLYERESFLPYEAMAIFVVVLLNAVMGYIQESRAEEAVAVLIDEYLSHNLPHYDVVHPVTPCRLPGTTIGMMLLVVRRCCERV